MLNVFCTDCHIVFVVVLLVFVKLANITHLKRCFHTAESSSNVSLRLISFIPTQSNRTITALRSTDGKGPCTTADVNQSFTVCRDWKAPPEPQPPIQHKSVTMD